MLRFQSILKLYLISFLVLPNYFAISIPGLPLLTVQRVILLLLLLFIVSRQSILNNFIYSIKSSSVAEITSFCIVMVSMAITGVCNGINNFFNPLFDWFIAFLIFRFMILNFFSFRDILKLLRKIIGILCLCGIVEFVLHFNIFTLLDTGTSGLNYGSLMRGDSLRICTAFGHPLAYSLVLNMFFPLLCYNVKDKKINIFQHKCLLILVCVNVLFTGSRSGIAVFIAEMLLMYFFTNKKYYSNLMFYSLVSIVLIVVVLVVAVDTSLVQNILRSIMYVIDELFGTEYALLFGGVSEIANSSNYRNVLWRIFGINEYQTLFGRGNNMTIKLVIGGFFVNSIDNYYVNAFLRFGIIGLFSLICFFVVYIIKLVINMIKKNNQSLSFIGLVIIVGYTISLLVVDELATMRYMMFIFSLLSSVCIWGGKTVGK